MKRQKGFTLVEVLVSTAIFMGMTMVFIGAYIGCQRSFVTGTVLLDLHAQTRQSLNWARKDIKWAIAVETSQVIGGNTYTTGDNELVLSLWAVDGSMNLITGSKDYVVYHLNDSDPAILERIVSPGSGGRPGGTYIIAHDVSALNFSSGGTGLGSVTPAAVRNITISLTTEKTLFGGRVLQSNAATNILLRNF